jgi:gliding motility-associated lipoprotein GldH
MNKYNTKYIFGFAFYILLLSSCTKLNVFEKDTNIPNSEWQYSFKPSFQFNIIDTMPQYNLYVVLRHTDAYNYNNICLNMSIQAPADTTQYQRFDLQLGNDANGWEGSGMDDIWEVRKPAISAPFRFHKSGTYNFSVAQIMRENPLKHILSVGVRLEKIK